MRRRAALALGLVAVAALSPSCGYTLSGLGASVLPEHVSVVAVVPFENRTRRPEIEQRVTEEVTQVGIADAVLEGAVTRYQTRSVGFSTTGRATRIEAEVLLQATVRDRKSDEVLWSQSGLVFKEQFDVPPSGEFFDQETLALDDIARGAAEVLVSSLVEGF